VLGGASNGECLLDAENFSLHGTPPRNLNSQALPNFYLNGH
jgi:hypothetical protein